MFTSTRLICVRTLLVLFVATVDAFAQGSPVYNVETHPPRGFMPSADQLSTPFDSIEPYSGKLHVEIPLASLPAGPAGSGFDVDLVYDSNLYELVPEMLVSPFPQNTAPEPAFELWPTSRSGGWTYNFNNYSLVGEIRADASTASPCPGNASLQARFYRLRVGLPDGSLHVLHLSGYGEAFPGDQYASDGFFGVAPDGRASACAVAAGWPAQLTGWLTYYTSDGSYLKLELYADGTDWTTKEWRLYFKDGRRVVRKTDRSVELYDANGNLVTIRQECADFPNCHIPSTTITDAANRQIRIDYGGPIQIEDFVSRRDRVSVAGPAGMKTWTIDWQPFNIGGNGRSYVWSHANWDPTRTLDTWIAVVKAVQLPLAVAVPAGQTPPAWNSYAMGYSDNADTGFGELDLVRTPGGAVYEYRYALEGQTAWTVNGWKNPVKEKKVTFGPAGQQEILQWTYARPSSSPTRLITGNPDGSQVIHWFELLGAYQNPANSFLSEGLVYKIEEPHGSVRKRVWAQNMPPDVLGSLSRTPINPYVQRETVTVGNAQGVPSQTAVTEYRIDKNGNSTETRSYDWVAHNTAGPETGLVLQRIVRSSYWVQTPDGAASGDSCGPASYNCGYWRPSTGTPWAANVPRRLNAARRLEVSLNGSTPVAVTELDYDDRYGRGNATVERHWDSDKSPSVPPTGALADANSQVFTRSFDAKGNLTDIHEPRVNPNEGIHTRIVYGNGIYPTQVNYAFGTGVKRTWAYEWNVVAGTLISRTDSDNGVTTAYSYDVAGRQRTVTEGQTAGFPGGLRRIETIYDDVNLRVVVRRDLRTLNDGRLQTETHYDALERPVRVRTSEPGSTEGINVKTVYHAAANRTIQSTPHRTEGEAGMEWSCTQKDALGRLTAVAVFSGSQPATCSATSNRTGVTTTAYDGGTTTVIDPANKLRREVRDGLGRLVQVIEDPSGLNYSTAYVYDPQDNLTQVVQGAQVRTFNYSSLRRLKSVFNPESGWTQYHYYDSGDLKSRTDARGVVATFNYDALRRPTSKTYADAEQTPSVTYTYHTFNAQGGHNVGQMKSVTSAAAENENTVYDALGRVTSSRHTIAGSSAQYIFGYSYLLNDAVQRVTNPSGRALNYEIDDAGRIARLSGVLGAASPTVYADLTPAALGATRPYTADGRIAAMKLGNTLWEARHYQELVPGESRLATTYKVGTAKNGQDRLSLEYNFSSTQNNGNLVSHMIRSGSQVWSQRYAYDGVNRLVCAAESPSLPVNPCQDGVWRQAYGYDRWGNRWVSYSSNTLLWDDPHEPESNANFNAPTTYFAPGTNHLSVNGADYDRAGNQTVYAPWTLAYDAENRNVRVSSNANGNGTFAYDGEGRRVKKVWTPAGSAITSTTYFVYNALGQLAAEYSTQTAPPGTHYIHTDLLGSTRLVTDSTGAAVECYDYLPFGRMLSQDVNSRNSCHPRSPDFELSSRLPQKFTGKERDSETRLDYFGARYYSGAQGRFISADRGSLGVAITDPQSWNLYAYTRNRPLTNVDPNGNWSQPVHHDMVRAALSGLLSAGDIQVLIDRQIAMDKDQSPAGAFKHAMGKPGETGGRDTLGRMWDFVAGNLRVARADAATSGRLTQAGLTALGDAIHTVQDYTSPMHRAADGRLFLWRGAFRENVSGLMHMFGEDAASDSWTRFGEAIHLTLAAFLQASPDQARNQGLTTATLNGLANQRIRAYVRQFFGFDRRRHSSELEVESSLQCALGNSASCQ